jgi:hypothetical protein
MNLLAKIDRAVAGHAQVVDLRKAMVIDKANELERETETSHANAMDVTSAVSAVASLISRTATDPLAKRLAASQEAETLEELHKAIGRLLRFLSS